MKENHLLLRDLEESRKACGKQTEFDAKLKGFQDRACRCREQFVSFRLVDDCMDNIGTGECRQLASDNPLLANK